MNKIEKYLKEGLRIGYTQNNVLHTSFTNNENSIVEYLLTVNVAQQLIVWNEINDWIYSIYLEYPTEMFFKNAFLPYMEVGTNLFDCDIIHPEVIKSIKNNKSIRSGRIDLAVCKEKLDFLEFKESLIGIELKGLNPSLNKVIEDIDRLVLAIEMKDNDFKNSINAGYCLYIKKLGGDKRLSSEETLKKAMDKSIENIEKVIKNKVATKLTEISIEKDIIEIKTSEDFANQGNTKDLSSSEVGEGTKIVFAVIVKINRV